MQTIFRKLFESPNTRKKGANLGDPALRQGARFNSMQRTIVDGVLPDLPLMEQTTAPGLKSIIETFFL